MSRIKVSDLEITERGAPVLVYVEPAQPGPWSDKEPKLPVLHISTHKGKRYGHYSTVTLCNRVMEYDYPMTDDEIDTRRFRLCARCAKKQNFDEVLAQYHDWRAACERKYQESERIKAEQARRDGEERCRRLVAFCKEFFDGAHVNWIGTDGKRYYAFTVEHNGHIYRIEEKD